MSNDNSHLKHDIVFLNSLNNVNSETPIIAYTFNVVLTDTLLMFHICHLYHNCLMLIDKGEMKESEIDDILNLNFVLKSVQEALDNRIKTLSASYIDDNYKWCYERPKVFDECLRYFSIIKEEMNQQKEQFKSNQNVNSDRLCDEEETSN